MSYCRKYTTSKGNVRYRAEVRTKGAKAISKSFSRLTDAKLWARDEEIRMQRLGAGIVSHKNYTLTEAIERYLVEHFPTLTSSTGMKNALRWWQNELGERHLDTIRAAELISLRFKLSQEPKLGRKVGTKEKVPLYNPDGSSQLKKPKTVQMYMDHLRALFNKAVDEWEWMTKNPMKKIKKLKIENGRNRFLSDHYHRWPNEKEPRHWDDLSDYEKVEAEVKFPRAYEMPRLFDALKAQQHVPTFKNSNPMWTYYLCIIQLSMGLRLGEASHMVWEENEVIEHPIVIVDFERKTLLLKKTKSDATPRSKPLSDSAMEILTVLYNERRFDTPLVFPQREGKQPFKFRARIDRAIRESGLQDFRWHDLRHTTASYLSMMGAGQREIMEALHHKTLVSSQRYQHLSGDHMRGLMNKLSDSFDDKKQAPSRFKDESDT